MSNSAQLINEKASTNPSKAEYQIAAHPVNCSPEIEKRLNLPQLYDSSTEMVYVRITHVMLGPDIDIDLLRGRR